MLSNSTFVVHGDGYTFVVCPDCHAPLLSTNSYAHYLHPSVLFVNFISRTTFWCLYETVFYPKLTNESDQAHKPGLDGMHADSKVVDAMIRTLQPYFQVDWAVVVDARLSHKVSID